ncbi:hypothetical protein KY290_001026 [Solanum tuberosum]|uniref:Uncharacterized protein n=1 Tax=Solanum tuberosum TaxID=4113 RepID=A0ABQ7WL56_SOLTU|nr:hypothetical protein KY290_001026 [Solanum tuberosum]
MIIVNDGRLRTASEASQRSTKEDWEEWMRHFSFELLKESPSPALRTCARLAQLQVEFMEHDERPLPIDICLMGALAGKCRAFEKALHYKEMEFEGALSNKRDANHVVVVEALIHINNQLRQYERLEINICSAAFGGSVEEVMVLLIVAFCCTVLIAAHLFLLILDDAIKAYTAKASQASSPHLCLDATLARWEELNNLRKEYWTPAEPAA